MMHASRGRAGQTFQRLVLPLVLFVVIMAGLAWVMQNVPQTASTTQTVASDKQAALEPLVVFDPAITNPNNPNDVRAVWDPADASYVKEFEPNVPGHYDFSFENISKDDLEMGLANPSCDCLKVEAVFVEPAELTKWREAKDRAALTPGSGWKELPRTATEPVIAPAGKGGLLRLSWNSRRGEGQSPRLAFKVWFHPKGKPALHQEFRIDTLLVMVPAVMCDPAEVKLGPVSGKKENVRFNLWSSTREEIKLTLDKSQHDPRFECKLERLDAEGQAKLQAELKKKDINTRIKAAYRLRVDVYEKKDDKWLDQGYFVHSIPLELDGTLMDKQPMVQGFVQGAVQIGSPEDRSQITLKSFAAADGITRSYAVGADPKVEIAVEEVKPAFLAVKLTENKKESTSSRKIWTLEVKVPPATLYGPLPENSHIMLRTKSPQIRSIRIPVSGIGVQGQVEKSPGPTPSRQRATGAFAFAGYQG